MNGPCPPSPGRARGFTLVELVAVVTLVAALGAGFAVSLAGAREGRQLREAGRGLAAELQYARSRALLEGEPQQLSIDVGSGEWQASSGRRGQLPTSVDVSVLTIREEASGGGVAGIRFYPDGSSTGGVVRLAAGDAELRIEVAWLSGAVSIRGGGS